MDTETIKDQLTEWLSQGRYGKNWDDHIAVMDDCVKVVLFTESNSYLITATTSDYLGCVVTSRKPLAGETWARGNDLADGKFTAETWNKILCDILSYELVAAVRPVQEMLAERKAS